MMKRCTKCGEQKTFESFHKGKAQCKICVSKYGKTRKEYFKEIDRRRRESGESRLRSSGSNERYRSRTDEEVLADRLRLRPDGKKKCAQCREILDLDKFGTRRLSSDGLQNRCRRCTKIRYKNRLSRRWEKLGLPFSCVYCGGPYEHADHVMPKFLGGSDSGSNLVPACERCNLSKGCKHPLSFLSEILPDADHEDLLRLWQVDTTRWLVVQ